MRELTPHFLTFARNSDVLVHPLQACAIDALVGIGRCLSGADLATCEFEAETKHRFAALNKLDVGG